MTDAYSPTPPPAAPDRPLYEHVAELVSRPDLAPGALVAGLRALEHDWSDEVYAELLFLVAHLRFEPLEARRHWGA